MRDVGVETGLSEAVAAPEPSVPPEPAFRRLLPGDRIPSLRQACGSNPSFAFDTMAGRYHLLAFFLSSDAEEMRPAIEALAARPDLFRDHHCAVTAVSVRPDQAQNARFERRPPGLRFAWDLDLSMSRACGAAPLNGGSGPQPGRRLWVLVDPSLHVLRIEPMRGCAVEEIVALVAALPEPNRFGGMVRPAPILMLPNVLEPELCGQLIGLYEAAGGEESGVVRGGKGVLDPSFKRRKDYTITDPALLEHLVGRIRRRVLPEIERLFFMDARHIERHTVGCYAAEDGGHFSPHTDNSPGITEHRRFAVSINLNDDFDGGEVIFPEYNSEGYKAPAGWAVVFPCAALHAVRRVRTGKRYAYLPFVYDEAGRLTRKARLAEAAARS